MSSENAAKTLPVKIEFRQVLTLASAEGVQSTDINTVVGLNLYFPIREVIK